MGIILGLNQWMYQALNPVIPDLETHHATGLVAIGDDGGECGLFQR